MLERFVNAVTLQPAAAEYRQRADYYRQRAVIESIKQGAIDHVMGNVPGVEMIDSVQGTEISIPGTDKNLQLAFDKDGVAFARIEGGMYYPITTNSSDIEMEGIRHNESLSESYIKRLLYEGTRRQDRRWFELTTRVYEISDRVVGRLLSIHSELEALREKEQT